MKAAASEISALNEALPERVFLHVGMTKAGSTAIQNAFDKNREYLQRLGILFPSSILSRRNPFCPQRTSGHLQLIRSANSNDLGSLIDEVRSNRDRTEVVAISAENIFLDLDVESYRLLSRIFRSKNVHLFCIVRQQLQWCASRYYGSVVHGKHKETSSFDEFTRRLLEKGKLNYYRRIRYLQRLFGAQHVTVVDHERVKAEGGSVKVALRAIGIDTDLPITVTAQESNYSSPYPEAIEAHRRLNSLTALLSHEMYLNWCCEMEAAAESLRERRGIAVRHVRGSKELRATVAQSCDASNRKLSAAFLEGRPFCAADDAEYEPVPLDPDVLAELLVRGIELLAPHLKRESGFHARITSQKSDANV